MTHYLPGILTPEESFPMRKREEKQVKHYLADVKSHEIQD